jgi:hypothetical protein
MSITWISSRVGYDGDLMYGNIAVDYWQPRESFEVEMEAQIEAVRKGMLAERDRLAADMERG